MDIESKAIRRCLWAWELGTLIRIAEALCALFFFGYYFSNISLTVDVVSGFLRRQFRVLTTPISAFVFGNGIVLIIFVLSVGRKDCDVGVDEDSEGNAVFHEVCEEYESHQKSSHLAAEDSPEGTGVEKQMVFSLAPEEVKEITTATVIFEDVNEIPKDAKVKSTNSNIQPGKDEICMQISGDGEGKANGPIPSTEESVNKGSLRRRNSEANAAKRPSMTGMSKRDTDNGRSKTVPIGDGTSPRPSSVDELTLKSERYIASQKLFWVEETSAEQRAGNW